MPRLQICQENGLVPIVEPEVTLGPGNYSIEETAYWSEHVYSHVFRLLNEYGVFLEGIILKPNMILPGAALSMTQLVQGMVLCCARGVGLGACLYTQLPMCVDGRRVQLMTGRA